MPARCDLTYPGDVDDDEHDLRLPAVQKYFGTVKLFETAPVIAQARKVGVGGRIGRIEIGQ